MRCSSGEIRSALREHLAWWGLTRFTTDREYFAWQRQQLSRADLNQLLAQAERKRSGDRRDDISFYDLTAQPAVLPVLYSQRYDYYDTVGLRVLAEWGLQLVEPPELIRYQLVEEITDDGPLYHM